MGAVYDAAGYVAAVDVIGVCVCCARGLSWRAVIAVVPDLEEEEGRGEDITKQGASRRVSAVCIVAGVVCLHSASDVLEVPTVALCATASSSTH